MAFYPALCLSVTGVVVFASVAARPRVPAVAGSARPRPCWACSWDPCWVLRSTHGPTKITPYRPTFSRQPSPLSWARSRRLASSPCPPLSRSPSSRCSPRVPPGAAKAGPGAVDGETPAGHRGRRPYAAASPPAAGAAADTVLPLPQRRRAGLAVAHQFYRSAAHRLGRPAVVPRRVPVCVAQRARPAEPNRDSPSGSTAGPAPPATRPLRCQHPFPPPLLPVTPRLTTHLVKAPESAPPARSRPGRSEALGTAPASHWMGRSCYPAR